MWLLAFAIYAACKWLTWRRTPACGVALWRHAAYLLAWPGMDADAFLDFNPPRPGKPAPREWLFAGGKLTVGMSLLFGVTRLVSPEMPYLLGWVGMIGLVLVLHFGIFHLLSCGWRSLGVKAQPLMNWPLASSSVSEFWGRRWNLAFRDLTYRFLFRPIAVRVGARWATLAAFIFSGLVHDLVISVPAGAGHGGPTFFFTMQGVAILVERTKTGRNFGLGRGCIGWLFAMLILLAPLWCLFHPPFIERIIVPFFQSLGITE